MYKILMCVLLVGFLSGCGGWGKAVANVTGHSTACIDGVEYIQFASGVTVAYTPDGKIKTCK